MRIGSTYIAEPITHGGDGCPIPTVPDRICLEIFWGDELVVGIITNIITPRNSDLIGVVPSAAGRLLFHRIPDAVEFRAARYFEENAMRPRMPFMMPLVLAFVVFRLRTRVRSLRG